MATNLISGLASGIDWKTMVDQLIAVDHQSVDLVTNKQKADQSKLTEWQGFNTKLLALKTAATSLKDAAAFGVYKATMTTDNATVQAGSLLSVTSSTTAIAGSYNLKINKLAVAQKLTSGPITSMTTALGAGYAGNLIINGTTIAIDATDTLLTVRDKINNANAGTNPTGVTAGLVSYSANDNRLLLTSDATGAAGISGLSGGAGFGFTELTAGANASLTINNVAVTRTGNSINDLIPGVTLDLLKADTNTTINLTIGRDTDAILAKINAFVTGYNNVSSYINTQLSYDQTKKQTGGLLFGDGTLSSVKSDLTTILTQGVWGVSSAYSTLGLVGINVDRTGQLSVNNDKLRGLLNSNFNDVMKLFTVTGTTSVGTLTYLTQENNTKPGEYNVHITAAATQSTSVASDNASLSGDEQLTITAGKDSATVQLTNGMSMAQVVSAISSELATVYTQKLAGFKQLYADAGQADKITAATKWNSVYDGLGNAAHLVNDDTIFFSGTTHTGAVITGSYTIKDIASDSVQGLLGAVETAFGNEATATINSSGQILVTDKTAGSSKMALTLSYGQAHDLDFGSILTTNAGGQKGRYAMDMTAATDGGNHLILNSNNFGTGHSFTIHQQNNLLWNDGDQTVNNGVDVAGTINGESATGTGQVLKGNKGDANVDGLSIKYTGTAGGIDAGNAKVTLGVGELYNRALFGIADPLEGYVAFKQKSMQNEIDQYVTQIDDMEARLARKKDMLLNKYAVMETALQKIQSQSSWLTAQTQAASNGWYKSSSQ